MMRRYEEEYGDIELWMGRDLTPEQESECRRLVNELVETIYINTLNEIADMFEEPSYLKTAEAFTKEPTYKNTNSSKKAH